MRKEDSMVLRTQISAKLLAFQCKYTERVVAARLTQAAPTFNRNQGAESYSMRLDFKTVNICLPLPSLKSGG